MTLFDDLLRGTYPKHLCEDLESAASNKSDEVRLKVRLDMIQRRIDEIDAAPDQQLPFERRILAAIAKDLRFDNPRWFYIHNKEVFNLIDTVFQELKRLNEAAPGIASGLDSPDEQNRLCRRLRIAAFLHDTGKSLEQSRHPVLGWHVMTDLATVGMSDKKAKDVILQQLKGAEYKRPDLEYRWLARLVRDHDKFGVISTGEASYVILGSMMHYGSGNVDTSHTQLRDTWLLNLADIGGTALARPPSMTALEDEIIAESLSQRLKVRDDKFEALTSDWKEAAPIFKEKSFSGALDGLRQISGTPEFTVRRIKRLLIERSLGWGSIGRAFSDDLIEDALETHFSPRDLFPFCRDLGMVAKLDYALQFWNELADYVCVKTIINRNAQTSNGIYSLLATPGPTKQIADTFSGWNRTYNYHLKQENSPWIGFIVEVARRAPALQEFLVQEAEAQGLGEGIARTQADLLIAILRRVVAAYRGLIRGGGVSDNAPIGVGFSYLRSDDKEKQLALYELLSSSEDGRERGLRWLIDEIASWELLA